MRVLLITVCSISLTACMVGPSFHTPASPQTHRFTELPLPSKTAGSARSKGPDKKQYFANGYDVPSEWWRLFHSKSLNCLIEAGLQNSPNLQAAKAALRQAEENWRSQIGGLLLPAVDAQFSAIRQRSPLNETAGINALTREFTLYNSGVNISYALDIFGGSRRQLEAYGAQVDYQAFQLEAAYLALTANIVTTTINIASLRAQIQATQEIIRSLEAQLRILKKQFDLGAVSGVEVLTQETQLAQTRASLPPLQQNLAKSRDALAVLVGQFPSEAHLPQFTLNNLTLPKTLPVSLPSALVRQRPDVRAQEALLHAASAQIGVATANLFPQFTLTGSSYSQTDRFSRLFSAQNIFWTYGTGILQPIFHGGQLIHARRAAIAGYDQAAAVYRQTVLQAFQNVADSLEAIKNDAFALQAEIQAESAAARTLFVTTQQYRLGGTSYLFLLNAQRQYQQAKINRIQAQAARFADTAALFQALGGGWWNRDIPLPSPQLTEHHP